MGAYLTQAYYSYISDKYEISQFSPTHQLDVTKSKVAMGNML